MEERDEGGWGSVAELVEERPLSGGPPSFLFCLISFALFLRGATPWPQGTEQSSVDRTGIGKYRSTLVAGSWINITDHTQTHQA